MASSILNKFTFRFTKDSSFTFAWVLCVYFLTSLLFRISSIVYLNPSFDEATYLIAGKALYNGKIFIVDIWDFKPIGIFVIAGFVAEMIPSPLLMFRILGILIVAMSGYLVYKVKIRSSSNQISFATGVVYIVITSLLASGIQTNTELFFNFFTITSLYFIVLNKPWSFILSGFAFGMGFVIKYVVAFDYFIFILFFIILGFFSQRKSIKETFMVCAYIFIGFLVPIGIMCLYFITNHAWMDFLSALFQTKKVYATGLSISREMAYIGDFILSYLPVNLSFLLFMILFLRQRSVNSKIAVFTLCWFIAAWIPIILQGKHFVHYYIQALLPLSFVSADILFIKNSGFRRIEQYKKAIGVLFIILLIYSSYEQIRITKSNRKITGITEYMKKIITPADNILAGDNRIYFELDRIPVSRYVHSSILFNEEHIYASGIDIAAEYAKIFSHNPTYVILAKDQINSTIKPYLSSKYFLLHEVEQFNVYRRFAP